MKPHCTHSTIKTIVCSIRKYGSTSSVGMGQVQNGLLYIRYRSSSMKNEVEECKKLINYIPAERKKERKKERKESIKKDRR